MVATYINFVQQFSDEIDIKLVSAFSNGENDIEAFNQIEIIDLSPYVLDNRFFRCFSYLKRKEFRRFFHAIASGVRFFGFIPIARKKTNRLFRDSMVIAVSPAAAMFVGSHVRFILEIHTKFEYFWGDNIIGRLQSSLAAKPTLTVFRNKTDADKARPLFTSDFIYNGVEMPPHSSMVERRKPFSALYVGGLVEHKNPLLLVRCAETVHRAIPEFTLDIYGVGELEETLRHEIEQRGLEKVVCLKGFVDDKSIYSRYEQFWFSSKLEGFGLVIVEAMANGTPVITTNWGDAVFEIVRDQITGFIVNDEEDFSERAIALFADEELRDKIAKAAYEDYTRRFSTAQNKKAWEKILATVYPHLWRKAHRDRANS